MKAARVWLSFDLGIQGDYESLYAWLDSHQAKECGPNVATFNYDYEGDDLAVPLRSDLVKNVEMTRRSRMYVIFSGDGGARGKFLVGSRKSALWTGSGDLSSQEDDRA